MLDFFKHRNFLKRPFFKDHPRRLLIPVCLGLAIAVGLIYELALAHPTASTPHLPATSPTEHVKAPDQLLNQLGQSLIDQHQLSDGGWRFKSSIQAPHYQTDRDVGAASVGMGFLALATAEPHDSRWLNGAKQTANWLMAVSRQDGHGGRYWADYVDDQATSSDVYTSFDDGTIGIGDFFWQLYEKTHDSAYKQVAIESVNWTLSKAELYQLNGLSGYRWKWNVSDNSSPYYMGMGEGAAGITYALAEFYQRLEPNDPALAARCKAYMLGSLNYINSVRQQLANNTGVSQTIPETGVVGQEGDTELDSGYLSGAAGDSFMYLSLYNIFGDKTYLDKATGLLGWLSDSQNGPQVKTSNGDLTWRLALDPQAGNNNSNATGVEEGNAGIGWTYLQAYKLTGNRAYLSTAESAANWLLQVAVVTRGGGLSWPEDENPTNPLFHANLNNGTAGIGMFLYDLSLADHNQAYLTAAQNAMRWLTDSAKHNGQDLYWQDNGGNDPYTNDPSWHWGLAGIIEFVQRLHGGPQDILGEQPGLE